MADKTAIEELYLQYSDSIENSMLDDDSVYKKENDRLEESLLNFGLTNQEIAKVVSESTLNNIKVFTAATASTTMDLLRTEKDNELKDKQIEMADIELLIKEEELKIKKLDVELKHKELEIAIQALALKKNEVISESAKAKLINEQVDTEKAKQKDLEASATLKGKQTLSEVQNSRLIENQAGLVNRQIVGYGDNLIVKAAEYEGGLASFAVNAGSDDAQAAINNFMLTIGQLKARAF